MADRRCGFVHEIFVDICDVGVIRLDAGLRLLPVVAELNLSADAALVMGKALLVLLNAVDRRDVASFANGSEPGDTDIDTEGRRRHGK